MKYTLALTRWPIVVVSHQPKFTWAEILSAVIRHPRNFHIIGPDTALFCYQIARKLHWWKQADRIKRKLDPSLSLSYCGDHYEVHQNRLVSLRNDWRAKGLDV